MNKNNLTDVPIKNKETPLVNICLITYNHENFIAQTIESILMQQTNFHYQIVIGEDCSTDRTRDICLEYQKKYPDKIRLLLNKKNLGAVRNHYETHNACTAKYIAMLDGDDYWTDPLKLQKQFDFMENNPTFATCFHKIIHQTINEKDSYIFPENQKKSILTINDIIAFPTDGWIIMTSSIFLRNDLIGKLPSWFYDLKIGDITLIMLATLKGDIFFIDEVLGARRANPNSLMEKEEYSNINIVRTLIKLFRKFNVHTNYNYKYEIYQQLSVLYYQLIKNETNENHFSLFWLKNSYNYYKLMVKYKPQNFKSIILFWSKYSSSVFLNGEI